VFVATFQAIQNEDVLTCYSVYTFDLPSYLPLADFVVVVDPELPDDCTVVGGIDWNDFERILGPDSIEQVDELTPIWYRLVQPLSVDQKDRIRQSARPIWQQKAG